MCIYNILLYEVFLENYYKHLSYINSVYLILQFFCDRLQISFLFNIAYLSVFLAWHIFIHKNNIKTLFDLEIDLLLHVDSSRFWILTSSETMTTLQVVWSSVTLLVAFWNLHTKYLYCINKCKINLEELVTLTRNIIPSFS